MDKDRILSALTAGKLRLEGQFIYGSNYTFMVACQYQGETVKAVYKPRQGERPLWDFPEQSLGKRETAAFLVSDFLGWRLVPPTVFRTRGAPMGPGSLQVYIEHDPEIHYFTFTETHKAQIPRVVLFDLLINNADRKSGHLLIGEDGGLWLIDHGLSFHVEDKLRTVIWELAGEPIPGALLAELDALPPAVVAGGALHASLTSLLAPVEIRALKDRAETLLDLDVFPQPPEDRRAYPWPLI